MENIEKNEIITTEAMEELTNEATTNSGKIMTTLGYIGIGVLGAMVLYRYAVKPVARRVKKAIQEKKLAKRQNTKTEATDEIEMDDLNIDEIPEIDE